MHLQKDEFLEPAEYVTGWRHSPRHCSHKVKAENRWSIREEGLGTE